MYKILIIEDDNSIRRVIKYDLKQSGYDVYEAENGEQGLEVFNTIKPDLIVVDYMMPVLNGYEVVQSIRSIDTKIPIIMLTAINEEQKVVEMFDIGVDDYVTKPFSPMELMARVKRLLARINVKNDSKSIDNIIIYKNILIDKVKYEVFEDGVVVPLPLKEYELLLYLVQNKGIVLSRDNILNTIWQFSYDGDTRIVDVHISKLRDRFKTDIIKTKRGVGYSIE